MVTKIKATKTVNPLHFEDLEPHRFEDLVRRLLYGFRDWSNIEATGRGGSDDGFDIRAWERGEAVTNANDEGDEGAHVLDGRLWQVQGKREKTINPAKMRILIRDGVDGDNPPYGYILAAATNISKKTYDLFRAELRKKGVSELHFWGKDYLEDQLSLPQNDEILFTFFGLSLSPRRRSRITEVKFGINNKNKITKLIFDRDEALAYEVQTRKTFFLRDINADRYPDQNAYPDFEKKCRWAEFAVARVEPGGVYFKARERYAYLDRKKKQWDVSMAVDLTPRKQAYNKATRSRLEAEGRNAQRYWQHLPRNMQAKLVVYGFVFFGDMLIIDERGDPEYSYPHIFIDFGSAGPFRYSYAKLVHREEVLYEDDLSALEKITLFPTTFPASSTGMLHDIKTLGLDADAVNRLMHLRGPDTLYSFDDKLNALAVGTLIHIPRKDQNSLDKHAEVTHVYETTVEAVVLEFGEWYLSRLSASAGRDVATTENVTVHEIHEIIRVHDSDHILYIGSDGQFR